METMGAIEIKDVIIWVFLWFHTIHSGDVVELQLPNQKIEKRNN